MKSTFSLIAACAAPLGAALLLSGCQTIGGTGKTEHPFPEPDARWKTATGQLRYATPQRSVIGEATVSRLGAEEYQLDFVTGPGVPLMRMRASGDQMLAEGLFARGRWSGRASRSGRLGSWASLREAFAALDQQQSATSAPGHKPAWTAQRETMPPKKERITVEFPKSKERFIFVLPR